MKKDYEIFRFNIKYYKIRQYFKTLSSNFLNLPFSIFHYFLFYMKHINQLIITILILALEIVFKMVVINFII